MRGLLEDGRGNKRKEKGKEASACLASNYFGRYLGNFNRSLSF